MERQEYIPPQPDKQKEEPPFKISTKYLIYKLFFPHLKNRGKREYFGVLVLRSSVYLAIGYMLSILFGIVVYFISDLSEITYLIWSPDQILALPFALVFTENAMLGDDVAVSFVTYYIMVIIIPFFLAGLISGIFWRDEARDLILGSSILILILFILLHASQELLFTYFSNAVLAILTSFTYFAFILLYGITFMIFSAIGGYFGVLLGKLITNITFTKKGAKVAYSHLIMPQMPLTVKTIFDLAPPERKEDERISSMSLVYLNRRIKRNLQLSRLKTCPYFEENQCAYLGYVTASHKYQICVTDYWSLCKVYAFLSQSKKIIEEAKEGEKVG
jgi:hypothetical protein